MNKESGLSFIGVFFSIIFIIVVIVFAINMGHKKIDSVKESDIKSNMLLIKGACKGINDEATVNKNTSNYVGTVLTKYISKSDENISNDENALSDGNTSTDEDTASDENTSTAEGASSNENTQTDESTSDKINDSIINDFVSKKIITESEYEDYYVLSDEDLKKLEINVENEENSYYLVNYKSGEVIITSGIDGKYKLSEIE